MCRACLTSSFASQFRSHGPDSLRHVHQNVFPLYLNGVDRKRLSGRRIDYVTGANVEFAPVTKAVHLAADDFALLAQGTLLMCTEVRCRKRPAIDQVQSH